MSKRHQRMACAFTAAIVLGLFAGADHPINAPSVFVTSAERIAHLQMNRGVYTGPVAAAVPGTIAALSGSPDLPYVVSSEAWRVANRTPARISMMLDVYAVMVTSDTTMVSPRFVDGTFRITKVFADSSTIPTRWAECGDTHCLEKVEAIHGRRVHGLRFLR